MKNLIEIQAKIKISRIIFISILFLSLYSYRQNLWKLVSSADNPSGNGLTTSSTLFFQKNIDDPNGNTFVPLSSLVSVTLEFKNPQYTGQWSQESVLIVNSDMSSELLFHLSTIDVDRIDFNQLFNCNVFNQPLSSKIEIL